MTSFNFYLYIAALITIALVFWMNRSTQINAPANIIEDLGETVVLRPSLLSRVTKLWGKQLKKTEIAKLQKAGSYLTLFHQSGNAYDLWISEPSLAAVIKRCQELFPHAEYVEI